MAPVRRVSKHCNVGGEAARAGPAEGGAVEGLARGGRCEAFEVGEEAKKSPVVVTGPVCWMVERLSLYCLRSLFVVVGLHLIVVHSVGVS